MKPANWRDIAELIGIAAIVASLLFVGLQMQQEQEIAITETHSSVTQSISEIAAIMEASPQIWIKGLDGAELSTSDRLIFLSMVEAVESHFFNMYLRFYRLEIGPFETLARDWAYALYIHPGLRQAYLDENEFNTQRSNAFDNKIARAYPFRQQVLTYLTQLDDRAPPIPSTKRYVFW